MLFKFIGVLILLKCLNICEANFQQNGCLLAEEFTSNCQCNNIYETNGQINSSNLEYICNNKRLKDFDLYQLFRKLENSYTTSNEEDHQEKLPADDTETILNVGNSEPVFNTLNITNSGISVLDFRLFNQVHFKSIQINNNKKLKQILRAYQLTNETFSPNDSTNKFSLNKLVPIEIINDATQNLIIEGSPFLGHGQTEKKLFDQISRFKALKSVTLANNGLKLVPDLAFENAKSKKLRSIDLKENRIKEIGIKAFAGLPSLNRINLDGNDLVKMHNSLFTKEDSQSELMMIFLRYNRLNEDSFHIKTFEGLEKRHLFIYLTGNLLTSLPESVFGPLLRRRPQRTFITLFENPLNCDDCSLRWLYEGKSRFNSKVFGAVCIQTQKNIWNLPEDYYQQRCL